MYFGRRSGGSDSREILIKRCPRLREEGLSQIAVRIQLSLAEGEKTTMILITGGAHQGKLNFAKTLAAKSFEETILLDGEHLTEETSVKAAIISRFHLYIRILLTKGHPVKEEVKRFLAQNPDVILTVTELGCGIVPMDAFDRQYRETVGRICCMLAEEAQAVYRVTCGIGIKIK
jgi:adenosylcobinamide kinase/adenosylcobinamide-phosphate guanylyltransferase